MADNAKKSTADALTSDEMKAVAGGKILLDGNGDASQAGAQVNRAINTNPGDPKNGGCSSSTQGFGIL